MQMNVKHCVLWHYNQIAREWKWIQLLGNFNNHFFLQLQQRDEFRSSLVSDQTDNIKL